MSALFSPTLEAAQARLDAVAQFHQHNPWSTLRWDFGGQRMAVMAPERWFADGGAICTTSIPSRCCLNPWHGRVPAFLAGGSKPASRRIATRKPRSKPPARTLGRAAARAHKKGGHMLGFSLFFHPASGYTP